MQVLKQTKEWLSIANEPICLTKEDKIAKIELIKKLIIEELDEGIEAIKNDDESELYNSCADAYVVLSNYPYYLNLDDKLLEEECDLVFKSNCTKFCKELAEAELTKIMYESGTHPNKQGKIIMVDIHKTGSDKYPYIIKGKDGKILKAIGFKDVEEIRNERTLK